MFARSLSLGSVTLGAAAVALFGLSACSRGDETARLDRIDKRLDALERRLDAAAPGPAPATAHTSFTGAASAVNAATYSPGAIAVVHAAPTNPRLLSEVPPDSVGGFIYTGGPLTLHDLSARGVRYTGLAGVELQGWLKATEAGRYQFGADLHGTPGGVIVGATCVLELWLEDRVVGSQQSVLPPPSGPGEERTSLVVGADLQPGLYKLRLWTACTTPEARGARITADVLIKAPSDLNLRGIKSDELLHQPT